MTALEKVKVTYWPGSQPGWLRVLARKARPNPQARTFLKTLSCAALDRPILIDVNRMQLTINAPSPTVDSSHCAQVLGARLLRSNIDRLELPVEIASDPPRLQRIFNTLIDRGVERTKADPKFMDEIDFDEFGANPLRTYLPGDIAAKVESRATEIMSDDLIGIHARPNSSPFIVGGTIGQLGLSYAVTAMVGSLLFNSLAAAVAFGASVSLIPTLSIMALVAIVRHTKRNSLRELLNDPISAIGLALALHKAKADLTEKKWGKIFSGTQIEALTTQIKAFASPGAGLETANRQARQDWTELQALLVRKELDLGSAKEQIGRLEEAVRVAVVRTEEIDRQRDAQVQAATEEIRQLNERVRVLALQAGDLEQQKAMDLEEASKKVSELSELLKAANKEIERLSTEVNKLSAKKQLAPFRSMNIANEFEFIVELGKGSMGRVEKRREIKTGRLVAVKFMEVPEGDVWVSRFQREVQILKETDHPNVIKVFDWGIDSPTNEYFYVMEYIEGSKDLEGVLRADGVFNPAKAIFALLQTANGLQSVQPRGIVHRDLKPGNLLVTKQGIIKLADFGIAFDPNSERLTEPRMVAGTIGFLSPEQSEGSEALDCKSDIFALGTIFYYLLTRRMLFEDRLELYKYTHGENRALESIDKDIKDPDVRAIIKKMIAVKPGERYQNYNDLILRLLAMLESRLPGGGKDGTGLFALGAKTTL